MAHPLSIAYKSQEGQGNVSGNGANVPLRGRTTPRESNLIYNIWKANIGITCEQINDAIRATLDSRPRSERHGFFTETMKNCLVGDQELAWELVKGGFLNPYQHACLMEGRLDLLRVGDYNVVQFIGEGGMGIVYKGERGGQYYALKFVRPDLDQGFDLNPTVKYVGPPPADDDAREGVIVTERASGRSPAQSRAERRHRREYQALSKLHHPNIVQLHEVVPVGDTEMIVMEYVNGPDIGRYVVGNKLPHEGILRLLRQVADALVHAHAQKVLHRDIKPRNILVVEDRQGPQVKLLDFGLAKSAGADQSRLSISGEVAGTPAYMPPEVARQGAKSATEESDIYSLGATMYELLGGIFGTTNGQKFCLVLRGSMVQPDTLHALGVAPDLIKIVTHSTSINPHTRPSAQKLRDELDTYLQRVSAAAPRSSATQTAP
jgi:serine/threonine protein kinase